MSAIVAGAGEEVYNNEIEGQINAYMGLIFEEICKQYLWKIYIDGRVAVKFKDISRWWGSDPKTKSQVEIDIMGVSHYKNTALFAECKWTNEKVDLSVLEGLIAKSELFSYGEKHFYLFAKSGFTKGCVDRVTELGNVTLVGYEDMV